MNPSSEKPHASAKVKKFRALSWNLDPEELKNQVDNYSTLSIWKSYRKQIVLIVAFLALLTLLVLVFAGDMFEGFVTMSDFLYGLILYIPVLFFVYKGHRWAIIALMILWTFEQGYKLILGGGGVVAPLIYWYLIFSASHKALQIENARRRPNSPESAASRL
ncbi:MAG: hypothetical protein V4665_01805 [Patescibacteria group bacterium]